MTRVISEPLLMIFIILAYSCWYWGARKASSRFFWLMGVTLGLAYLTKGTAQLLLVCFAGWVVITGYWKRWQMLLGVLSIYLLTASPLLVYNAFTRGNPFYNYNSAHAFWYDSWDDAYWAPDKNFSTFISTHTIGDMVDRFIFGITYLFDSQGEVILPPIAILFLLASIAIYVFTYLKSPGGSLLTTFTAMEPGLRNSILIPAVIIPVWIIFFAWFAPVSNFPRHVIPLVPLISTIVSIIFYYALTLINFRGFQTYFPLALNLTIVGIAIAGGVMGWRTLEKSFTVWDVYVSDRLENKKLDELLLGLESLQPEPVTVISGPSHTIPAWRARSTTLTVHEIPVTCKSIACLEDFIRQTGASYLVIDAQMIRHLPFLTQYFKVTGSEDFEVIKDFPLMELWQITNWITVARLLSSKMLPRRS
jgi:hypothetical protein